MIKDAQVRKLRQYLGEGHPLYRAALKVGMDAKSARKYRHADRMPSESVPPNADDEFGWLVLGVVVW